MTSSVRSLAAAAALLAALTALSACGEEDGPESTDGAAADPTTGESSAPAAGDPQLPEVVADGEVVTGLDFAETEELGDALVTETLTEGDGPAVEAGQTITVNYYGSLYGEETPFDESYSGGQPATFPIGVGGVIPGWDEALVGVPVGSRVSMAIPPDLGYGAAGRPPVIPPDSDLYFVVDVIEAA